LGFDRSVDRPTYRGGMDMEWTFGPDGLLKGPIPSGAKALL
jgi:hypothetical protein